MNLTCECSIVTCTLPIEFDQKPKKPANLGPSSPPPPSPFSYHNRQIKLLLVIHAVFIVCLTKYQFYQIEDRIIFLLTSFARLCDLRSKILFPFSRRGKIAGLKIVEFTYWQWWLKKCNAVCFFQKKYFH